jgi:hypothetical protein
VGLKVALSPGGTLSYPNGGGHLWAYLNWALALQQLGAELMWLEADPGWSREEVAALVDDYRGMLARFGVSAELVLFTWTGEPVEPVPGCTDLSGISEADLLLNFAYELPADAVSLCSRSALVDIDPGLTQLWMADGVMNVAPHDVYLTVGETVGTPAARFPDCGLRWHYVPRPVFLDEWPVTPPAPEAPYTTVAHWWCDEWITIDGQVHANDKRDGFREYIDVPAATSSSLELALLLDVEEEVADLKRRGWLVRDAWEIVPTPDAFRDYVRRSRGEFSCAKPSCGLLENAWISDRTVCYLATGRPAIVEHTGASRFLPDADGLFRFRSPREALRALDRAEADYDHHSRAARALAEEHFDAVKVVGSVLETSLA